MAERECIFAWTQPDEPYYPPFFNITREEDGTISLLMRGVRRPAKSADNPNEFDLCGRDITIKMPPDMLMTLESALRGHYVRQRVEWENHANERRPSPSRT